METISNFISAYLKSIDVDGETMEQIIKGANMEEQMLRQLVMRMPKEMTESVLKEKETLESLDRAKYIDEINALKHSCSNLEHRLAMVLDDCKVLRKFINLNAFELFLQPSEECSEAMCHLLNIEIACDLESDESYTWKLYSKQK